MLKIKKFIISLLLIFVTSPAVYAAGSLFLKAKLDSTKLLMGKVTMLHLDLVTDKGRSGDLPVFSNTQSGIVTTCGDSVELHLPSKIDTIQLGSGRLQISYSIPVQVFDSGMYRIPPIEYVSGNDTVRSNSVMLKVVPLGGLKADDNISAMQGVVNPDEASWIDKIPDLIYYGWWWMLLALIAICVITWLLFKYGKKDILKSIVKKPVSHSDPWSEALNNLEVLKKRKLFENGEEKEYYTNLTEILRIYLERRFSIKALEMTSAEILDTLARQGENGSHRDYVRQILDVADFVKFAKMRPLLDEAIQSMAYARKFIEETIPPQNTDSKDDTHEV